MKANTPESQYTCCQTESHWPWRRFACDMCHVHVCGAPQMRRPGWIVCFQISHAFHIFSSFIYITFQIQFIYIAYTFRIHFKISTYEVIYVSYLHISCTFHVVCYKCHVCGATQMRSSFGVLLLSYYDRPKRSTKSKPQMRRPGEHIY